MVKLVENTEETVHAKKLLDELRSEVREALSGFEQIGDDELYDCIEQAVAGVAERQYLPLGQRIDLKNRLFDSFRRLDILQELVDDPEVTEIMVNGKDHIFVERSGRLERWDRSFEQVEQLEDMIQQIVSKINRVVNVSRPIADARLVEDGSRVHIVLPPIALDGPVVTIRKFPEPITIDRLIRYGSLTREAADFLEKLVRSGYNIFISGGTGSGKTTFLNALSAYIPETERVITIEDSAELQITQIPNLVRLETRRANAEGEGAVEISDLIRASLRMRPNYLIVGEVRGKECLDMLQALNTGHFGLSTGHGNSARDMLSRLETMTLMAADIPLTAVRGQIASAIDILVHLGRLRDRSRRVLEITEVTGYAEGEIQLNPLYRFEERGDEDEDRSPGGAKQGVRGSLTAVGTLARQEKLHAAGYSL
ncbi:CpaF family protein [Clostridium sp. AM33-3]|uniref:CpaF family protein n=1 Tax=Clostridium sp. AM33-3 TaxID=2292304 RepID=UPI000E522973|nr:CpaF family protein [Clostridium sp. AM33-3]RHT24103.1 CpaF family protein [Clostridium sp. AM33-3]